MAHNNNNNILFNQHIFPALFQVTKKVYSWELLWHYFLQAGCPSCNATKRIKVLKDDSVPKWGQTTCGQQAAIVTTTINNNWSGHAMETVGF